MPEWSNPEDGPAPGLPVMRMPEVMIIDQSGHKLSRKFNQFGINNFSVLPR